MEEPMLPLVSVVVPTFNRRHLIARAIQSIAEQTYPRVEVIVVDDASTDGTAEFLESSRFKVPLRVIRLERNSGPSVARNTGIAYASGKYVALLDSDDSWLPRKLTDQVEAAERSSDPDRVLVYSVSLIRRRHEMIMRPRRPIGLAEPIADYLFCGEGYLGQSAVLLSAAMARTVPYPADLRLHEDWDWFIRLQQEGVCFVMLPGALCIVDDRATEGRASQARPAVSLAVAARWKPFITRRAYLAFVAKVAPQLRGEAPLRAARFILAAYTSGAITSWQLAILMGRLAHPELREWAYRVRALGSRLIRPDSLLTLATWILAGRTTRLYVSAVAAAL